MSAVIERSGVARATVYRRWPNREALLIAALREVKGRGPVPLTGDLETDIARSAEQARHILAEERFRSILPLLARDLVERGGRRREGSATFHRVAPNHRRLADVYEELAAGAGLRDDIDGELVSDIIIGAQLARLLSTGRPPSKRMTDQLVEVVLAGLRRRRHRRRRQRPPPRATRGTRPTDPPPRGRGGRTGSARAAAARRPGSGRRPSRPASSPARRCCRS